MARTLPWLKDGPSTSKAPRSKAPASSISSSARPAKRQRLSPPPDSDSDTPVNVQHSHPSKAPNPSRIPSSSPPPTSSPPPPPPSTEAMRPGLSADDIHIMVEDEFLSTAHTFTSHLHRAEYARLKNLSRSSPKPNLKQDSRPVDSLTKMRAEMKRQKEAEAQARKVGKMMGTLNGAAAAKRKALGGGDEEAESDSGLEDVMEERGDEVGAGTALRHLMRKDPEKNLGSLSGLQGVRSETRAARGFEPAERGKEKDGGIMKAFARDAGGERDEEEADSGQETEDGDSDDLDKPTKKIKSARRVECHRGDEEPKKPMDFGRGVKPAQKPRAAQHRVPTPSPSPPRIHIPPSPSPPRKTNNAVLERIRARREKEKREKEKVLAIDEIPLFLA